MAIGGNLEIVPPRIKSIDRNSTYSSNYFNAQKMMKCSALRL